MIPGFFIGTSGFFRSGRTLEVGSLDINGSIRGLFEGGVYIGLDVALGPGVDVLQLGRWRMLYRELARQPRRTRVSCVRRIDGRCAILTLRRRRGHAWPADTTRLSRLEAYAEVVLELEDARARRGPFSAPNVVAKLEAIAEKARIVAGVRERYASCALCPQPWRR